MTIQVHGNFGPSSEGGAPLVHGQKADLSPEEEHRMVRGGCASFIGTPPKISAEYARELDAMFPKVEAPKPPLPANAVKPAADDDADALTDDEPDDDDKQPAAKSSGKSSGRKTKK